MTAPSALRTRLGDLSWLWWVRLPRQASRLPGASGSLVADGHFLAAYPVLGATATPVAAGCGLGLGAVTIGYARSFSESLTLMLVAVFLGFLATQLGAAFMVGFVSGDFLIGQPKWIFNSIAADGLLDDGVLAGLLRLRLPMLIGYLVLGLVVVLLPVLVRVLVAGLPGLYRLPNWLVFAVVAALSAGLAYVAVLLWTGGAPVLVRPLYTWSSNVSIQGNIAAGDLTVPVAGIEPLQRDGGAIAAMAAVASVLRSGLTLLTWREPWLHARTAKVESALAEPIEAAIPAGRFGPWKAAVLAAVLSTMLLAGMMAVWWVAAVLFVDFRLFAANLGAAGARVRHAEAE